MKLTLLWRRPLCSKKRVLVGDDDDIKCNYVCNKLFNETIKKVNLSKVRRLERYIHGDPDDMYARLLHMFDATAAHQSRWLENPKRESNVNWVNTSSQASSAKVCSLCEKSYLSVVAIVRDFVAREKSSHHRRALVYKTFCINHRTLYFPVMYRCSVRIAIHAESAPLIACKHLWISDFKLARTRVFCTWARRASMRKFAQNSWVCYRCRLKRAL